MNIHLLILKCVDFTHFSTFIHPLTQSQAAKTDPVSVIPVVCTQNWVYNLLNVARINTLPENKNTPYRQHYNFSSVETFVWSHAYVGKNVELFAVLRNFGKLSGQIHCISKTPHIHIQLFFIISDLELIQIFTLFFLLHILFRKHLLLAEYFDGGYGQINEFWFCAFSEKFACSVCYMLINEQNSNGLLPFTPSSNRHNNKVFRMHLSTWILLWASDKMVANDNNDNFSLMNAQHSNHLVFT